MSVTAFLVLSLVAVTVQIDKIACNSVIDTANDIDELQIFANALKTSKLDSLLEEAGPYTVFAPTNLAFQKAYQMLNTTSMDFWSNEAFVTEVLEHHVVIGKLLLSDLSDGFVMRTLQGQNLSVMVTGESTTLQDAKIVTSDVSASNGVIHTIDRVLLPPPSTQFQDSTAQEDVSSMNIVDTARELQGFSTLISALEVTDLVQKLTLPGPYTVFAPTDAAFAMFLDLLDISVSELLSLPNIADVLKYHVVEGEVYSQTLKDGAQVETLLGPSVTFSAREGRLRAGDAVVTMADIRTSNGLIHVVDKVLVPPVGYQPSDPSGESDSDDMKSAGQSLGELASSDPRFSILAAALGESGLTEGAQSPEAALTVFAPTNAAFEKLMMTLGLERLELLSSPKLKDLLLYHIVVDKVDSTDLRDGMELETLLGKSVLVSVGSDGVSINEANVVEADIGASNGIIHVVDSVLVPDGMFSLNGADSSDKSDEDDDSNHMMMMHSSEEGRNTAEEPAPVNLPGMMESQQVRESDESDDSSMMEGMMEVSMEDAANAPTMHSSSGDSDRMNMRMDGDDTNGPTATAVLSEERDDDDDSSDRNDDDSGDDGGGDDDSAEGAADSSGDDGDREARRNMMENDENMGMGDGEGEREDGSTGGHNSMPSLNELAQSDERFSILAVALNKTGLAEAAEGPDSYTVFAPTNSAFISLLAELGVQPAQFLSSPMLTDILLHHVVEGTVESADLFDGQQLTNLLGRQLTVRIGEEGVSVDGVSVLKADVRASNGVVHYIGRVLMPPGVMDGMAEPGMEAEMAEEGSDDAEMVLADNLFTTAASDARFSILIGALVKTGLDDATRESGPLTVFAPTNAAFMELISSLGVRPAELLSSPMLKDILLYHVVEGKVETPQLSDGDMLTTLLGEKLNVSVWDNGTLAVNDAAVTQADIKASNGVVHVVDAVLVPPGAFSRMQDDKPPRGMRPFPGKEQERPRPGMQPDPKKMRHRKHGSALQVVVAIHASASIYFSQAPTVEDILRGFRDTSLLAAVLDEKNLSRPLDDRETNFTVFAPTDAAVSKLLTGLGITFPELLELDGLPQIMKYHIVPRLYTSFLDFNGSKAASLTGEEVQLTTEMDRVMVNDLSVIATQFAANGVIHLIGSVMTPPGVDSLTPENVLDIPKNNMEGFSVLVDALQRTGLSSALTADGPFTLFAPTNMAFRALASALNVTTEDILSLDVLEDILKYHVVQGKVTTSEITGSFPSLLGPMIQSYFSRGSVFVNGAEIVAPDLIAKNGVVHIIDSVMLPPTSTKLQTTVGSIPYRIVVQPCEQDPCSQEPWI